MVRKNKKIKITGIVFNSAGTAEITSSLAHLTFNLDTEVEVRHSTMEGRAHLVVPMVMMVEGVLNGSEGPLLYPGEELAKTPAVWNHKPVVVYHPVINGKGVSACSPDIINTQKIGVIMNTRFEDGKLKADAWIEKDRANKIDDRIIKTLEEKKMMELSTGLFTDNEAAEGEFNGKAYTSIARNYRPDHLAILPDKIGACSLEDGAGFLRLNEGQVEKLSEKARKAYLSVLELISNEISHNEIWSRLQGLIEESRGDNAFVSEVFDTFFIYMDEGKLFRQGYSKDNDIVILLGESEEVVRVTEFRKLDGTFVGNLNKEKEMNKEQKVAHIIKNTKWEESDKEFLMSMEDAQLDKMVLEEKPEDKGEGTPAPEGDPVIPPVAEGTEQNDQKETAEQYIANAPPAIRDMLNSSIAVHNAEKAKLVKVITENKLNTFSEANLQGKDLQELKAIATLAQPVALVGNQDPVAPALTPMYVGLGDAAPTENSEEAEEVLLMPALNWDEK